ncbi:hypothetical protein PTKIN_Ptkin02bG0032600 [Pterospermum kingtungense]
MNVRMKNSDIISNLPDNITEQILGRLPIRDAVRTSVLSTNWRYKWTTLSDLVFDAQGTHHSTNPPLHLDGDKLVKVIYSILCQHKGPIHKFSLSVRSMSSSYSDIDQWLKHFLSRNGIREFILLFGEGNWYKLHSSLFSCANLRNLSLFGCVIPSPPPTFGGFNDLSCLKLQRVSVSEEGFQNLIAKCPKLYTLNLIHVDGLDGLYIDYAPNLTNLVFIGSPNHICLKNTPHLVHAGLVFTQLPDMNQNIGNGIYNLNFLSNLPSFVAGFYFLKFLAYGSVRKLLPSTFENRYYICIYDLMFEDIDSLSSALGLITSSPNLTQLKIKPSRTTNSAADQMLKTAAEYLEGKLCSIGSLMKLRYVEMKNIVGVGSEMELIKLILAKSPSLEKMKVTTNKTLVGFVERETKILKELIRFPRASKIAEIIHQD